ncbi:MAG: tellurite resistance TerB family protein [Pseudomonadota bacterium]
MALNQLLDQFLGGQQGNEAPQKSSNPLANVSGGLAGGLAAGGLLGLLAGSKKVRKTAGNLATGAVGVGGAAALGALAYKAYQSWQQTDPSTPAHVDHTGAPAELSSHQFDPAIRAGADGKPFEATLIKSMIAAANADGHIDEDEQARIFEAVEKMQLDPNDKALIFDTLRDPPDVQAICSLSNGLEQATEIYLVSRMAIDVDDPREFAYLRELAEGLSLPMALVDQLDEQLAQPQPIAA